MTTAEAAKQLGIHRSTLAGYARRGLVRPAMRLPTGQLRWRVGELIEQIRALDPYETDSDA